MDFKLIYISIGKEYVSFHSSSGGITFLCLKGGGITFLSSDSGATFLCTKTLICLIWYTIFSCPDFDTNSSSSDCSIDRIKE